MDSLSQRDFLSPSEREFRKRMEDVASFAYATRCEIVALGRENRRLRRALRVLASLQPERVRSAVMEVLNNE